MSADDGSDIIYLHNISFNGGRMAGGSAMEVSAQIELDLAYSSEKASNLELLVMQVTEKASDYEIPTKVSEELLMEPIEKAFQFDILSGFLNSELKEIEGFMSGIQLVIIDARKKFVQSDDSLGESSSKLEAKLRHAEESLISSQEQVADIRKQSDKFEKLLAFDEDSESDNCSLMNANWNLQSAEQQRHFLQSLEKSLAREMDLERKLSESRENNQELKMKLQFAEQDAYCSEGLIEVMMERVLEVENTVELLVRNSKELMWKLQNGQFSSSTSTKSSMEEAIVKPSAEEADSEDSTLRVRVNLLEDQLRESERQLQLANASVRESNDRQNFLYLEENNMENMIKDLREDVVEIQSREGSAEARCAQLMKANAELNDEVGFLRNNGIEKDNLEAKLEKSATQLEHAKAAVDAHEEHKIMLYTALNDMEHLIEDLKGKVSKEENRAEIAEAKCALLTDTNLELNNELSFLRGRLESLEASLHQADMEKVATADDIGNRTRLISELVKKLASERKHLQLQMSELMKRNKILTKKCLFSENDLYVEKAKNNNDHGNIDSYDETLSTSFEVDEPHTSGILETKVDPTAESAGDDSLAAVPNVEELVRTIEDMKYYIVFIGRQPGIYLTWEECQLQVLRFSGAVYRSVNNYEDAVKLFNDFQAKLRASSPYKTIENNPNYDFSRIFGSIKIFLMIMAVLLVVMLIGKFFY